MKHLFTAVCSLVVVLLAASCSGHGFGDITPGTIVDQNGQGQVAVEPTYQQYQYLVCSTTPAWMKSTTEYGANYVPGFGQGSTIPTGIPTLFKFPQAPASGQSLATASAVGSGMANTQALELRTNGKSFAMGSTTASGITSKLSENAQTSWYVPSLYEMIEVATMICEDYYDLPATVGFPATFWSSTENSDATVATIQIYEATDQLMWKQVNASRDGEYYVWPVGYYQVP